MMQVFKLSNILPTLAQIMRQLSLWLSMIAETPVCSVVWHWITLNNHHIKVKLSSCMFLLCWSPTCVQSNASVNVSLPSLSVIFPLLLSFQWVSEMTFKIWYPWINFHSLQKHLFAVPGRLQPTSIPGWEEGHDGAPKAGFIMILCQSERGVSHVTSKHIHNVQ